MDPVSRRVHNLLQQKRSLEWWNLAMLMIITVTTQGAFDDVKSYYLHHLDPLFLVTMQISISIVFIIALWYILRRLAPVNENLDSSRHVESQLAAIYSAHRATQDDIAGLRDLLAQMRDTLPAFSTLVAFENTH